MNNDLVFVGDFETSKDAEKTWVYLWGLMGVYSKSYEYGRSIDEFMRNINNRNITIYFHNAKFDVSFILVWLLKNGYTYCEKKKDKCFKTLYNGDGTFYSLKIWNGRKTIKILDSLKLLTSSVEKLAKDFGLSESKGVIDYSKIIFPNDELPDGYIDYLYHDLSIVASCLQYFFSYGDKMTIASNALNDYKNMQPRFKKLFPILTFDEDAFCRKAYKGGFCWKNPVVYETVNGCVFDVNSLYPYIMRTKLLPVYRPIYFNGEYKPNSLYPLYIMRARISCKIKNGYIPTIQLKNNFRFAENEYLTEINEPEEIVITSVDYRLIKEHYDILYLDVIDGYMFAGSYNLFSGYVDKWQTLKQNGNPSERAIAKLFSNSLYGKFGKNPISTRKIPYLEDDTLKFYTTDFETSDSIYVPVAAFITAYAREHTITAAQHFYSQGRLCYCDTDSVHIVGENDGYLHEHNKELGCWKLENRFDKAKFIRQKTYIEVVGDKTIVKCAGMSKDLKDTISYEDFTEGFEGVRLVAKNIRGGVALVERPFQIK